MSTHPTPPESMDDPRVIMAIRSPMEMGLAAKLLRATPDDCAAVQHGNWLLVYRKG